MRLKPIEPGMIIHCKNDVEYEQLNAEVIKLGYGSLPCKDRANQHIVRNLVFCIETDGVGWECKSMVAGEITEFSDLIIPELSAEEEAYNKGLNEAWDLFKKVVLPTIDGGLKSQDLQDIFKVPQGKRVSCWVLNNLTPQEALAKVRAYEKEQAEIKVGDVVYSDDEPNSFGVVTWISEKLIYVMWDDGSCGSGTRLEEIHKTGKHIDIEHLLKQIAN